MPAHRRARLLLLGCALVALASPAWAKRDGKGREIEAWSGAPLFTLSSPWSGARLAAGEVVTLAWRGTDALAAEDWIEEWEAFLSVDAGRSYSVRLTPHLDLGRRAFGVRLPELPTAEARLMFRLGNERRELELELPWTFEIVAARGVASLTPRGWAVGRGEAARPGDAGVVRWLEGSRDGRALVERTAARTGADLDPVTVTHGVQLVAAAPANRAGGDLAWERRAHPESGSPTTHPRGIEADRPTRRVDPRRATCRQNE